MTEKERREIRKQEARNRQDERNGHLLDIHEISGALYHIYEALKTETDPEEKKDLRKRRDTCRTALRYHISKFMEE